MSAQDKIFLEPEEFVIELSDGSTKTFTISKFPAIVGREIVCKYPMSALPKLGDYAVNEQTMLKLMSYVAAETDGVSTQLKNATLVNNHVPGAKELLKIELKMLRYNFDFFPEGKISNFLNSIKAMLRQLSSSISTDSLVQLLQTEKQPSKSSKKATP